jgi:hypothetical protein
MTTNLLKNLTKAKSADVFRAFKKGHLSGSSFAPLMPLINIHKKVEQAWQQAGGAASLVGIPTEGEISVIPDGDGWLSHFRGGTLRINRDGSSIEIIERFIVTFQFKALHCILRQESGFDEVYGSVGIITNPPGGVARFDIPTFVFNKTDHRIQEFSHSIEFLLGTSVALSALLVEHDSGDRGKVMGKIRSFYDDVEARARTLTDPLIGEELSKFTVGTLGTILNFATLTFFDLMGMGDDPFNPVSHLISWETFYNNPPKQTYSHQPDPTTGTYTFKMETTGIKGGRYACYFDFSVRRETSVRKL